jgi:L-threonylcarbamoyladenylate synthase
MIARAVEILRRGGLVAFPTETVYGLGADATSAEAIRRIFAAKGRPPTNPLICHVADESMARQYAQRWPAAASIIAEKFWPGPITIVVPKSASIPAEATAGRETVGLRAPNHPLALELLHAFGKPIAGPSANQSNHISPTTAQHVRDEMETRVDLILDGGPCRVGIESTVLDVSGERPIILRPGSVSREQIEAVVGRVDFFTGSVSSNSAAAGPGQQARHYAPRTRAVHAGPGEIGSMAVEGRGFMLLPPQVHLGESEAIAVMAGRPMSRAGRRCAIGSRVRRHRRRRRVLPRITRINTNKKYWLPILLLLVFIRVIRGKTLLLKPPA